MTSRPVGAGCEDRAHAVGQQVRPAVELHDPRRRDQLVDARERVRDRCRRAGLAARLDVGLRVDLGERPAARVRRADAPVLEVCGAQTGDDLVVRGAGDDVHGVMMPDDGTPAARSPPGERVPGQRTRS